MISPKYKSSATILYEGRENIFLRPDISKATPEPGPADDAALTSQVQLVLSRELALDVIKKLKLNELPEFDPLVGGIPPWKYALILMGVARNPMKMTAEERVLKSYYERLTAFPLDRSRVMTIEFVSSDPKLAARVTNAIADGYLELQQSAKQDQEQGRRRMAAGPDRPAAPARRGGGSQGLGVSRQVQPVSRHQQHDALEPAAGRAQLAAPVGRAQKADAEAGRASSATAPAGRRSSSSDMINSELMRRLSEQRVALRGQLAEHLRPFSTSTPASRS